MDPQRRPPWSPFFTTECAVAAHSRPTLNPMDPLFVAVAVASLVAAVFGSLLGLCVAFAKAEADPVSHPVLAALLRRRNPLVNVIAALAAWGGVLYLAPKGALALAGVPEPEALVLSMVVQFCVVIVFLLLGERAWKPID